jgi:DnaJ-class molecular chaperone
MAATLLRQWSGRQDHSEARRPDRRVSRYARGPVSADEETPEASEPVPCTVCRGTGTLISNLGGSPSQVTCAWCEGTGTFLPEHDAQAARRAQSGEPSS